MAEKMLQNNVNFAVSSVVNAKTNKKDQVSIDFLHLQLGIKLSELSSKLLQLEMKGVVVTLPGSRVSLR